MADIKDKVLVQNITIHPVFEKALFDHLNEQDGCYSPGRWKEWIALGKPVIQIRLKEEEDGTQIYPQER
jgi:hypothetical protein